MNTDCPHMPIDNPIFCLAQLCRDKFSEFYQADYTINDRVYRVDPSYKVALRIERTTIFRRLLSMLPLVGHLVESKLWLMTILFYKDHAMMASRRQHYPNLFRELDAATIYGDLEISYSDPKFMGILLSELRWVW